MKNLFKSLLLATSLMFGTSVAWAVPVTHQIGFALDASGSISNSDYNLVRNGLTAALAGLPQNGSVEITVVTFGANANIVVPPTLLSSATFASIESAINTHRKAGGSTYTNEALDLLTDQMSNSSNFGGSTISAANLTTDGSATVQSRAEAAAGRMAAAGIGSLSIEAVGSGVSSNAAMNRMLALAFPGPATVLNENETNIPNPSGQSWIVPVTDFTAYAAVLGAKVQAVISPPTPVSEPGVIALFAVGFMGLAFKRRQPKAA